MFKIHIFNNSEKNVPASFIIVDPGEYATISNSESIQIRVRDAYEYLEIIALNEKTIPKFELKGELGLLFRFKTTEIYSRYDGIGEYNITIDFIGNVTIETINGNSIEVNLPEMTLIK